MSNSISAVVMSAAEKTDVKATHISSIYTTVLDGLDSTTSPRQIDCNCVYCQTLAREKNLLMHKTTR
jgi:hypothetical protein